MRIEKLERTKELKRKTDLREIHRDKFINNFLNATKRYLNIREEIKMEDMATIDRIEGEYAVCELLNGDMVDIPLKQFKQRPSEGDIFNLEIISNNDRIHYDVKEKNIEEMEKRRRIILEKINRLKKR